MTATEMLDGFIRTLNELIESAKTRAREPDNFLAINEQIKTLIERDLPALAEAISAGELGDDARAHLERCLVSLDDLEAKGRARLVWAGDFEDYMRRALSQEE
jgi:hypothetical protein